MLLVQRSRIILRRDRESIFMAGHTEFFHRNCSGVFEKRRNQQQNQWKRGKKTVMIACVASRQNADQMETVNDFKLISFV